MSLSVPFLDLVSQYQTIQDEMESTATRVLRSGHYVLGDEVATFERSFATYCGVRYCVGLNTGTSAIHTALLAAGIGPGDEVITVPMTFVATVSAILYSGAKPILIDVDPATWTMNVNQLEHAITRKTRAIVPVHLHGQMADMPTIMTIAKKKGLVVIEDAAQAHGSEYDGKRPGQYGDLACYSFYPGKNLGACGEGGAVVTNSEEYATKAKMLRDWGQDRKYHHVLKGFNYRLDALQAALLSVKLRYIEIWTHSRRRIAESYFNRLEQHRERIKLPASPAQIRHVYHVYSVQIARRDRIQKALHDRNIGTAIHYPVPVHLQPAYADLGYKKGDFPVAEELGETFLSLPMFPELTEQQVASVCDALISTCNRD